MEIITDHINIEQLVALIEARQFPTGMDFTDPLVKRLYDAWATQCADICELTAQLDIASKRMKAIAKELDEKRRDVDWSCISSDVKTALAEIREQRGDIVSVRMNKHFSRQLRKAVRGFSPSYVLARLIKYDGVIYQEFESKIDDLTDEEFDEGERRNQVLADALALIGAIVESERGYQSMNSCKRCGGDRREYDMGFDSEDES